MRVGDRELELDCAVVMSIINVTPDSFYAGSRTQSVEDIISQVERAVEHGAAILDIGGYSSRPGADDVAIDEEIERVCRAVSIVRERHPQMIISIDTFRSKVAEAVIERYGACVINDISAGELDPQIMDVAALYGAPYIAMHMRATPATMQDHTDYADITTEIKSYFDTKINTLRERGVEQIIIDPGFGFAKSTWQNYELLEHLDCLQCFGLPILTGVSRKSMIYKVLETTPEHSLIGTSVLNWECLNKGASILRVHDTLEAVQVTRLFNYYKG